MSLHAAAPAGFDAANRLYDKNDFKGARAAYGELVKANNWSANLFYNLGDAAFREGDKGAAILAYERALALEAGHPEALANLRFLREATGARLPVEPRLGRILSWPDRNEAAWLAAVAFWGICFGLAPLAWKRRPAGALVVFCSLALIWSGAVLGWQHSRGETWIVTTEGAKARSMPADNSPALSPLPTGSHVRLLLERGPWVNIELPDASRGWIPREAVSPIRIETL